MEGPKELARPQRELHHHGPVRRWNSKKWTAVAAECLEIHLGAPCWQHSRPLWAPPRELRPSECGRPNNGRSVGLCSADRKLAGSKSVSSGPK